MTEARCSLIVWDSRTVQTVMSCFPYILYLKRLNLISRPSTGCIQFGPEFIKSQRCESSGCRGHFDSSLWFLFLYCLDTKLRTFISYSCQDRSDKTESWREKVSKQWNLWEKMQIMFSLHPQRMFADILTKRKISDIDVCQVAERQNTSYTALIPGQLV